jgi:biotin carboxyl carrier protein
MAAIRKTASAVPPSGCGRPAEMAWFATVFAVPSAAAANSQQGDEGPSMRSTLKMPKVGDAVDEVVVAEVAVAIGSAVSEGQTLFVVETDKTQVEVPAPFAGTVRELLIKAGDEVKTGAPTLVLEV